MFLSAVAGNVGVAAVVGVPVGGWGRSRKVTDCGARAAWYPSPGPQRHPVSVFSKSRRRLRMTSVLSTVGRTTLPRADIYSFSFCLLHRLLPLAVQRCHVVGLSVGRRFPRCSPDTQMASLRCVCLLLSLALVDKFCCCGVPLSWRLGPVVG